MSNVETYYFLFIRCVGRWLHSLDAVLHRGGLESIGGTPPDGYAARGPSPRLETENQVN